LANTGFQTVHNHIGLEPKHTARRYASVWNSVKWNLVKWNETRRIGAIFACFRVARVCQRQLGFLVVNANNDHAEQLHQVGARTGDRRDSRPFQIIRKRSISAGEMYSTICVDWGADPLLTTSWAENDFHISCSDLDLWPSNLLP